MSTSQLSVKGILKNYLPKSTVESLKKIRGPIEHYGFLLYLCPWMSKFFEKLPNSILRFLMRMKVLSYDFVVCYAIPKKERVAIMESYDSDKFYLNIGASLSMNRKNWRILEFCGDPIQKIGYRYHPELIDYDVDLMQCKQWDIPDGKADIVYTSHCLEHISVKATEVVFTEAFRIMKPGAVFRITLPNIDLAIQAYENKDWDFFNYKRKSRGENTLDECFLNYFSPANSKDFDFNQFRRDYAEMERNDFLDKYAFMEGCEHNYHKHVNWFDFDKLKQYAVAAGFNAENVHLSAYKQSLHPELRTQQFDTTQPSWSIYVDIVKD